jgi:hypothetical protein
MGQTDGFAASSRLVRQVAIASVGVLLQHIFPGCVRSLL